jgi:hypothetical protein
MDAVEWPQNVTYWPNITEKTAELAMAQSEAMLRETIDAAQSIQEKSDKLLALIVTLSTPLFAYGLAHIENWQDTIVLTSLCCTIILIVGFCILFKNIKHYNISSTGNFADTFINNKFIKKTQNPTEQFLQIALQVCKDYKFRTEQNDTLNETRSRRNTKVLYCLVFGLLSSPILAFIFHLVFVYHLSQSPCR